MSVNHEGIVYLVGAGPGAPDLMTVRARRILESADVILYDRLIDDHVLRFTKEDALLLDVGHGRVKSPDRQSFINDELVRHALEGRSVVRLKGGDPLIFGRGYEEAAACRERGIRSVVVPGLSSAFAAPTVAGIPITERKVVRSLAVVTASIASDSREQHLDFDALVGVDTLMIMMGWERLPEIVEGLRAAGLPTDTPAACVHAATTPAQHVVTSTLEFIVAAAREAGLASPVVTVIGDVARHAFDDPECLAGPLKGRRIVVTRDKRDNDTLSFPLRALGASVIECPMIDIRHHVLDAEMLARYRAIPSCDWVIFSSQYAVHAFEEFLRHANVDVRFLGSCRVAVIGRTTRRALMALGLRPDLMADPHTAKGMLRMLSSTVALSGKRVAYPHSNLSDGTLVDELAERGCEVHAFEAYTNLAARVDDSQRAMLNPGFGMIVFCSPSAVHRAAEQKIFDPGKSCVACLGPTTAEALLSLGSASVIMPEEISIAGLVESITDHFRHGEERP
ncbi:MAG: uroporphyrinogen-III C-methyltransferase [Phycisphaerae bacterium]